MTHGIEINLKLTLLPYSACEGLIKISFPKTIARLQPRTLCAVKPARRKTCIFEVKELSCA